MGNPIEQELDRIRRQQQRDANAPLSPVLPVDRPQPKPGPQELAGRLRAANQLGAGRSRQDAVAASQLSQRVGLPADVVASDLQAVRAQDFQQTAERVAQQAPVTASWGADPTIAAAVGQDGWDKLTLLERLFGTRATDGPVFRRTTATPTRETTRTFTPTPAQERGVLSVEFQRAKASFDLGWFQSLQSPATRARPQVQAEIKRLRDRVDSFNVPEAGGGISGIAEEALRSVVNIFASVEEGAEGAIIGAGAGAVVGLAGGPAAEVTIPLAASRGAQVGFTASLNQFSTGLAIERNLKAGIDPVKADAIGRVEGAAITALEVLGFNRFFKAFKLLPGLVGRGTVLTAEQAALRAAQTALTEQTTRRAFAAGLKEYAATVAFETGTETAQQFVELAGEDIGRRLSGIEGVSGKQYAEELLQTAYSTMLGMSIFGIPGGVITTVNQISQATQAQQAKQFLSALGESAAAIELRTQLPEKFQQLLQRQVDEYGPVQNIGIPVEQFVAYWQQQNVDPRTVAEQILGDATAFDQAVEQNADILIPLADFVAKVAGTEHYAGLLPDIRLRPDGLTAREADKLAPELEKSLKDLRTEIEEAAATTPTEGAAAQVYQEILDSIPLSRDITREAAEKVAQIASAVIVTSAKRANVDPLNLWRSRNISILPSVQAEVLYDAIAEMEDAIAENPASPRAIAAQQRVEDLRTQMSANPATAAIAEEALTPIRMPISAVDLGQRVVLADGRSGIVTGREAGQVTVRMVGAPEGETTPIAGDREVEVVGAVLRQARVKFAEQPPVPVSVDAVANVEAAFDFAGSQQFSRNRDFKVALQDLVKAAATAAGVDLTQFSPEVEKYLVRVGIADARTALRTNANAVGWYNEKVTKALRIMSLVHSELATDANAKFAFVWAMAVTSNGLKVDKNFELANEVYTRYKQDGVMPTDVGIGQAAQAINESFQLYNNLVAQYGLQTVIDFFTSLHTVKEVQEFTNKTVNGENLSTEVFGAAALGPKIGNGFFMNLYGEFGQLTMDRWFMRTWGRWTGTLVAESKANIAKKQSQLDQLIKLLTKADKAKLQELIGVNLATATLDEVGEAIASASVDQSVRAQLSALRPFTANATLEQKLVGILGEPKGKDKRFSVGNEIRRVGNRLATYLDGQKESPSGPPERGRIRQVMRQVLQELQTEYPTLTMADLQALLWYPEKRLYDAAKTADESAMVGYEDTAAPDYANAAVKLALAQNIAQDDINSTISEVDNELREQASAAADVGTGRAERAAGERGVRPDAGAAAGPAEAAGAVAQQVLRQSVTPSDESVAQLLDRAMDPRWAYEALPETIDVDGVERPTQNSLGQQITYNAKAMRAFWRWFGDSKAVDDYGRPIMMYHGTVSEVDFNTFRLNPREMGVHVGTSQQASDRVEMLSGGTPAGETVGPRILELYAKAVNPLRLKDLGSFGPRKNVIPQLVDEGLMSAEQAYDLTQLALLDTIEADQRVYDTIVKVLTDKGYDSIVYLNRYEGIAYSEKQAAGNLPKSQQAGVYDTDAKWLSVYPSTRDSYIVFTKPQVKSPANVGSFSGRMVSILRQADVSPVSSNVVDATAIFGEGRFSVVTALEETVQRPFFGTQARTPSEVAAGMSALARGADERFDVLLTDKDGKPIAIVAGSKGGLDFASVATNSVVYDIVRTPGAVNAWLVHNHPSGDPELSDADMQVRAGIDNALSGSGIDVKGIMAVAVQSDGSVLYDFETSARNRVQGAADPVGERSSVAFVERQIEERRAVLSPRVVGLRDVLAIAERLGAPRDGSKMPADGILMLNARMETVGFVEVKAREAMKLRDTPSMRRIQEGAALVNAVRFIVIGRGWTKPAVDNIQGFLNAMAPATDQLGNVIDVVDPSAAPSKVSLRERQGGRLSFGQTFRQEAYHGSPYLFSRFSLAAVGTGEGLARFGWGINLTRNKDIAARYRDVVSDMNAVSRDQAVLYKVDIPDTAILKMLEWEKPLSQQEEAVQSSIRRMLDSRAFRGATRDLVDPRTGESLGVVAEVGRLLRKKVLNSWDSFTGEDLYLQMYEQGIVASDEAASKLLLKFGVPGIKHRLLNSKADADTFVVFDENLVSITERNGQPVSASERADLFRQAQNMDQWAAPIRVRQARPNAFIIPGLSRTTIGLMNTANVSSLMHELSHDYLNMLFDLAALPETTPELKADAAIVLQQFGIADRSEITVEHQETWARMFESYLEEGKAPSRALNGAFSRMKALFTAIYRMFRSVLIPVSPEIRGVFDRMLASQEEIDAAQTASVGDPLFGSAEEAGMTDAEFASYLRRQADTKAYSEAALLRELLAERRKETRAAWQERREEVESLVTTQVEAEPIQQVVYFLRTGELLNGDPLPDGVEPIKLSKDLLVQRYGEEVLKSLPKGVYSVEGGIDPDILALSFGIESGDALVTGLQTFEPYKAKIKRLTNEIMAREFPDLMGDSMALADAAMAAVHRSETDQLLVEELRILGRSDANIPPTDLPTVKQLARDMTGATPVRNINIERFRQAELSAGRKAYAAMRRGDKRTAAFHKRQQLLNHILYREGRKALEMAEKARKFFTRMAKGPTQQRLGLAGWEYQERMNVLLTQYEFVRVSLRELDRRSSMQAWIDQQRLAGIDVEISMDVLVNDIASRQINYRQLTADQLQGVFDAGQQVYFVATKKNTLLADAKKRAMQQVEDEIVASIAANHEIKPRLPDYVPSNFKRLADFLQKVDAWHIKPEFLFTWLDGEKPMGPVWSALFKPIADAGVAEAAMLRDAIPELERLFSMIPKDRRKKFLDRTITVPGVDIKLTGSTVLAMALNWGNAGNREALLASTVSGEQLWTQEMVNAAFAQLTADEWKMVQAAWDYIDTFWPQIAALQRELTGVAPQKIEASPFVVQTADGQTVQMRGGYYPLVYDRNYNWAQFKADAAADVKDLGATTYTRAVTRHGFTEQRVGSGGRPVKLDLSVLSEHVLNVIHDLTHRKAILDVGRLIERPGIREVIEGSVGREMYRIIRPWLQRVAADQRPAASPMEDLLGRARVGVTVVNMGLKVTTAIVQPLGYMQTVESIGVKYARRGLQAFFSNPKKLVSDILGQSAELRARQQNFDRDVRDSTRYLASKGKMTKIQQGYFLFTSLMDMAVAVPSWYGAYLKSVETIKPGDHEAAVAYADQVVRTSQGSGAAKDLALIQGGGNTQRLFTMFYSYFSALYNLMRRSGTTLAREGSKDVPRFVMSMALLWLLPAVMSELIAGRGPDDDEDEMGWALTQLARYPASTIVGLRDMVSAIGPDAYDYDLSPAVGAFRSIVKTVNNAGEIVTEAAEGAGVELTDGQVKEFLSTVGYWGQLPTRQMWITGSYLYDLMMGYETPEGVGEFTRNLLFARPQ